MGRLTEPGGNGASLIFILLVVFIGVVYSLAISNRGLFLFVFVVGSVLVAILAQRGR